jgi:uncharacterized membrane protein YhdT
MTINKWLLDKGLWYVIVVIAAYSIAAFFDIVPQPAKDLVSWFDRNTTSLLFALCFLVACVTVIKVYGRKKKVEV